MLELLVRIEKILARTGKLNSILRYKTITVDVSKRLVSKDGQIVSLQPLEFDLLVILIKFKNCTLSRDRLLNEVWGFDFAAGTRTVDIHVAHLRKKTRSGAEHRFRHKAWVPSGGLNAAENEDPAVCKRGDRRSGSFVLFADLKTCTASNAVGRRGKGILLVCRNQYQCDEQGDL